MADVVTIDVEPDRGLWRRTIGLRGTIGEAAKWTRRESPMGFERHRATPENGRTSDHVAPEATPVAADPGMHVLAHPAATLETVR